MHKILNDLEGRTPGWLAVMEIQILLNITAKGFDVPGKRVIGLSREKALRAYAEFTRDCMNMEYAEPEKLYQEAYKAGERIRRFTGFSSREDLERLVFYLYKNIYISMKGELPGEITVTDCYFGHVYSAEQCELMSNVDSGIIAGIFGGGELEFTERISEGCGRCRACFKGGNADE
ncbi:MAG: hypothetical protein J6Q41_07080 [Firmicutes bacterium]|nr:hypothetical protein [Bacillota bacterium]